MINNDLLNKFKGMPTKELAAYLGVTKLITNTCAVSGIGSILLFMYFIEPLSGIMAALALYFCGKMAVNADSAKKHIIEILALRNKDK